MVVCTRQNRLEPVDPGVGVPEGRVTSPMGFSIAASGIPEALQRACIGLGVDPPMDAVIAFHQTKDGTDTCSPQIERCRELAELVKGQYITWSEAMQQAENDSNRLTLLELSSTVQVLVLQLLDDTKIKQPSWGSMQAACTVLGKAIAQMQGRVK